MTGGAHDGAHRNSEQKFKLLLLTSMQFVKNELILWLPLGFYFQRSVSGVVACRGL